MTIAFDGSGGLFTRLGSILGGINAVNVFRNTTLSSRITTIGAEYASNDGEVLDGIYADRDSYRSTHTGWLQALKTLAEDTLITQVNRDVPLSALTVDAALAELISQMTDNSESISRPTVSVTVTAGSSNYGTTKLAASLKDTDGLTSYGVLPETLVATVTSDAGRGATAYREPISVVGVPSVDGLDYRWPQGSGSNTSLTVTDATVDGIVTNGDFETWANGSAPPDSWTIGTGTAGTTVVRSTSSLRGSYAMQFATNASELTSVYQALTGLQPNTVYCVNLWVKRSSGMAAGVFRVRLTDGSGTTINDDSTTANTVSYTMSSGFTTSYAAYPVFFVTPRVLPSTVRLVIELTTAGTNAETVTFDLVSVIAGTRLYVGGPFVAAFSGGTQAAYKDAFDVAVANNMSTTKFVTLDRLFNLRQLGRKLPSASSNTIDDALIA